MSKSKSLLIHRSQGARPVNWQPSGTILSISLDQQTLRVLGIRSSPRETMKISFSSISLIIVKKLVDNAVFDLSATEFDMHKALMDNPELFESGFKPLEREKKISTGFLDIFGIDEKGRKVAIEIKKNPTNITIDLT